MDFVEFVREQINPLLQNAVNVANTFFILIDFVFTTHTGAA
jgi:hypothetical protein